MFQSQIENKSSNRQGFPIRINLLKMIFWVVFSMWLLLGGLLAFVLKSNFRPGVFSVGLICLLIPQFGIKIDAFLASMGLFFLTIVLSFVVNVSPLSELIDFIPYVLHPVLAWYLVQHFITPKRATKFLQFFWFLGLIQFPVVVFQRATYEYLPAQWRLYHRLSVQDFDFGTFYMKNDPALACFFIIWVAFLLFSPYRKVFSTKKRNFGLIYCSLMVLFINSKLSHIILMLVWGGYVLLHLRPKTIILVSALIVVIAGALAGVIGMGWISYDGVTNTFEAFKKEFSNMYSAENVPIFLKGFYSRGAAVYYYAHQPLEIVGDGPSAYYDQDKGLYTRGVQSHILRFYAEIGLLGLVTSYIAIFCLIFPIDLNKLIIRATPFHWVFFVVVIVYSVTQILFTFSFIFMIICWSFIHRCFQSETCETVLTYTGHSVIT